MIWAAILLAASALACPTISVARVPNGKRPVTARRQRPAVEDPLAAAASLDVLAACLRSGMAVPHAASAVADSAPPAVATPLRRAADLLSLGADPAIAWSSPAEPMDKNLEAFMRMARRSASSGAALAAGIQELAEQIRAEAANGAVAQADRASVLIAGPLGLCYLPAFLCLGVIPVVAGLTDQVLGSALL
ncbi:MAG: type II secretion system F family protein [Mycolicibacterium sp.]|uniref:type II secretion system F family protein n=1 Tax=Mycolicibacterium sp. TaxID=2320850 RepID=UPI003D150C3A